MRIILYWACSADDPEELINNWAIRDPVAMAEVEELLSSAGLSMDAVIAETIAIKFSDIERLDGLIMNAEARRSATLREIDRRRASQAQTMRHAIESKTPNIARSDVRKSKMGRIRDQRTQVARQSGECAREHRSAH